jgi:tRNA C32,U32 (ribose-2'-O)-methylase TrmJ
MRVSQSWSCAYCHGQYHLPANIGSALRAMKTMGLSKLVLVAPKTYPHPDIDALAAGAQI